MICLDACAVIALFNRDDTHHREAARLIIRDGASGVILSQLTLAEVLVGPTRQGRADEVLAAMGTLKITLAHIPADFGEALARIRVDTGLALPDSCVILTAESASAKILSFDKRLINAARARGIQLVV